MTPLPLAWLALAFLLAAAWGLYRETIRARHKRPKGQPTPRRQADAFLKRLLYRTAYEDMRSTSFRVDCFLFDFTPGCPDGLDPDAQYRLFEYVQALDLYDQRAITKIYLWLLQNGVRADLRFQYNRNLPLAYNIKQCRKPRQIKKRADALPMGLIKEYDLWNDGIAMRKPL